MADAPDRRERLLNLLAMLLETRRGLTQAEIVHRPELGYPPNPESARKAFERDKASLRAMGVPIRQESKDAEARYRVLAAEYYLPDLKLDPDELAALHVAVTAIALESAAGQGALMKLGGLEGEGGAPVARIPLEPALAPLFEASRRRAPVRFEYRGRERDVEPWGFASKFGRWYLVGRDRDVDGIRVYRADRIEGDVEVGEGDAFTVPSGFDAAEHLGDAPWQYGSGPGVPVRVRVDAGHTAALIALAGPDAQHEEGPDGSVVVTIPAARFEGLRSVVLGFLEHAEVLDPPEARADVIAWLEAVAAQEADA